MIKITDVIVCEKEKEGKCTTFLLGMFFIYG